MQSNLHEKIHLNSEDIIFIKNQINNSINSKINIDLPNDDLLKNQVLSYIKEFINESFELSRYSLIVDGKDMSLVNSLDSNLIVTEGKQEIEPFDTELNEKLRELYAKVDEETLRVTELRRSIGELANKSYNERMEKEVAIVQELLDTVKSDSEISKSDYTLSTSENEILDRVQDKFNKTSNELAPLQEQVTNTTSDLRKVAETIEYLQEGK